MHQKHKNKLHQGLHAVHFGFTGGLLAALACLVAVYSLAPALLVQAGSGSAPFASGSTWNTALPAHPALAANSPAIIQSISGQADSYGTSVDNTDRGAPVYVADPSTPTVAVTPWGCGGPADASLAAPWSAAPIPFYAVPSSGASNRMLVVQPTTQTVWEFSGMYKSGGQWFACKGGQIASTTVSSGRFPGSQGANTSGLAQLGGQISITDMQNGRVNHAIGLALPQTSGVPLGTRLLLDPALDLNSLGLSAYGKMVARAAQVYGFVVWDVASKVSVYAENPLSYTVRGAPNPYGAPSLSGFPWEKLKALPINYGTSNHLPLLNTFDVSATSVAQNQSVELSWQAINISECAIPGVASNLGASGTVRTKPLLSSGAFSISCSGPNGSVTRTLNVTVPTGEQALPPPPPQALNVTNPIGGSVQVVAELFDPSELERVQKVVFYDRGDLLQATTKTPFMLDTEGIPDGKYVLAAHIFYRDGTKDTQNISVQILNHLTPLRFTSAVTSTPAQSPAIILSAGMVTSFTVMAMTGWYGWHKGRLY